MIGLIVASLVYSPIMVLCRTLTLGSIGADPQQSITAPQAALIAAGVAGAIAVLNTLLNVWMSGKQNISRDTRSLLLDLQLKRLSEFYAPVKLLLAEDLRLVSRLREGKPSTWHLLDHITEVRADPFDLGLAEHIVAVNQKIASLLETKAGLTLGDDLPDSFSKFLGHQDMLSRAIAGKPFSRVPEYEYFPKNFEKHIEGGYSSLLSQVKKELGE